MLVRPESRVKDFRRPRTGAQMGYASPMERRTFLKQSAAVAPALAGCGKASQGIPKQPEQALSAPAPAVRFSDPEFEPLAAAALQAARESGATYADIRIATYYTQNIFTREQRVESIADGFERGIGVRVLAEGAWGFAATRDVTRDSAVQAARQAVAVAKANSFIQRDPIVLAPIAAHRAVWQTPIQVDPFELPLRQKVEQLLELNAKALAHTGVDFCRSSALFVKEHKFFASTEGSAIEQTLYRLNPSFTLTSVDRKRSSFQTRTSYTSPQGQGYEYIQQYDWDADLEQAAVEVVAKHTAKPVENGPRDVVIAPSNLWLTIHETIGHPTELDRALGLEANYAGTSFLTPDKLGRFQLGSPIVNFVAEKIQPGGLATCGYDDDGAKTTAWPLVEQGVFVDYQTTRDQAHWIQRPQGYATSYAQSWKDTQFQRMPNINLTPSRDDTSLKDLVGGVEDGILLKGRGSWSIDQQRYNFQFTAQTALEIKRGQVAGLLRDVAYQGTSANFWRSCDGIGGAASYELGGSFYDGKGEPGQSNAVSHGCPPARFRGVTILNTDRKV